MGGRGGPIGHRTFAVGSSVTHLESLPAKSQVLERVLRILSASAEKSTLPFKNFNQLAKEMIKNDAV
jgi:hypothetical protein